jgi:hypothetical protein
MGQNFEGQIHFHCFICRWNGCNFHLGLLRG